MSRFSLCLWLAVALIVAQAVLVAHVAGHDHETDAGEAPVVCAECLALAGMLPVPPNDAGMPDVAFAPPMCGLPEWKPSPVRPICAPFDVRAPPSVA